MGFVSIAKKTAFSVLLPAVFFVSMHECGYHIRKSELDAFNNVKSQVSSGFATRNFKAPVYFGDKKSGNVEISAGDAITYKSAEFGGTEKGNYLNIIASVEKVGDCNAKILSTYVMFPGGVDLKPVFREAYNPITEMSRSFFTSFHNWKENTDEIPELIGVNDFGKGKSEYTRYLLNELKKSSEIENTNQKNSLRDKVLMALAEIHDINYVPELFEYARKNPDYARTVGAYLSLFKESWPYVLQIAKENPDADYARELVSIIGGVKSIGFFFSEFNRYPERSVKYLSMIGGEENHELIYRTLLGKIESSRDPCLKIAPRVDALRDYVRFMDFKVPKIAKNGEVCY